MLLFLAMASLVAVSFGIEVSSSSCQAYIYLSDRSAGMLIPFQSHAGKQLPSCTVSCTCFACGVEATTSTYSHESAYLLRQTYAQEYSSILHRAASGCRNSGRGAQASWCPACSRYLHNSCESSYMLKPPPCVSFHHHHLLQEVPATKTEVPVTKTVPVTTDVTDPTKAGTESHKRNSHGGDHHSGGWDKGHDGDHQDGNTGGFN